MSAPAVTATAQRLICTCGTVQLETPGFEQTGIQELEYIQGYDLRAGSGYSAERGYSSPSTTIASMNGTSPAVEQYAEFVDGSSRSSVMDGAAMVPYDNNRTTAHGLQHLHYGPLPSSTYEQHDPRLDLQWYPFFSQGQTVVQPGHMFGFDPYYMGDDYEYMMEEYIRQYLGYWRRPE